MHAKYPASFLSLLAITVLAASSAQAAAPPPCHTSPAQKAAVAQTIRAMFAAAAKDDYAAFNRIIAPDFYIFDGGHQYEGDAILDAIKQLHAKGYVFVWTVPDPEVHIACHSNPRIAWITYTNRGSIKGPSGVTAPMRWLESAVLQEQSGHWRVRFFHSTRVPALSEPK